MSADEVTAMDVETETSVRVKGRGFNADTDTPIGDANAVYSTVDYSKSAKSHAAKSVDGWVLMVTNVHEEASEEDIIDKFSDFGHLEGVNLVLDRRTGYNKGYVLVEFTEFEDAQEAIEELSGTTMLEKEIRVDFAFVHPPGYREPKRPRAQRGRSKSPSRGLIDRID